MKNNQKIAESLNIKEYNQNGNEIYFENSNGTIRDNKPKNVELTMDEIAKKYNIPVENLKIKK